MKILLIEDNEAEARLVREELSDVVDATFDLTWVDSLSKGIERLKEKRTDLILLDLSLPDSKGLDTLHELKANIDNVPIIVLTSFYDEGLAYQAVQKGAQDYLFKGRIDSAILVRSIRYAIERHRTLMELNHYIKKSQSSEARFRSIVEKSPDGIVIVDREGVIRYANPIAAILFGSEIKDFIGEKFNYPLVTGRVSEIEFGNNLNLFKLELKAIETEWEGEIVHYVVARDIKKHRQGQSI